MKQKERISSSIDISTENQNRILKIQTQILTTQSRIAELQIIIMNLKAMLNEAVNQIAKEMELDISKDALDLDIMKVVPKAN